MSDLILALNCGSSSIKFALFDAATLPRTPAWRGEAANIGSAQASFVETGAASQPLVVDGSDPYRAALAHIRERVRVRLGDDRITAVAHRVVHGGSKYFDPVRVDAGVLADLRSYIPLAPLHQPFALEALAELLASQPRLPQIACFDTGFHRSMPAVEQMLPLPRALREHGLRRYGFHGLSYEYLAFALGERYGERAHGRTLCAHLGSGASLCAMRNLQSIATTMGFSALDGIMMNTRCGALDPGVLIHLMQIRKLSLAEVGHLLYHDSGLLGVSGISSDSRVLLAREHEAPAAEALALYVHRIVRETTRKDEPSLTIRAMLDETLKGAMPAHLRAMRAPGLPRLPPPVPLALTTEEVRWAYRILLMRDPHPELETPAVMRNVGSLAQLRRIIMGSEDKGIYPALRKATDKLFCIPMSNQFESFNVSVAAGIILYEALKQRMA